MSTNILLSTAGSIKVGRLHKAQFM